jgi:hypothetical protein
MPAGFTSNDWSCSGANCSSNQAAARAKAVEAITAKLYARRVAAQKLDHGLQAVQVALAGLDASEREVFSSWPQDLLGPVERVGFLHLGASDPLSTIRKQRVSPGVVRHLIERGPYDFTAESERLNSELTAALNAPLSDPDHTEAAWEQTPWIRRPRSTRSSRRF